MQKAAKKEARRAAVAEEIAQKRVEEVQRQQSQQQPSGLGAAVHQPQNNLIGVVINMVQKKGKCARTDSNVSYHPPESETEEWTGGCRKCERCTRMSTECMRLKGGKASSCVRCQMQKVACVKTSRGIEGPKKKVWIQESEMETMVVRLAKVRDHMLDMAADFLDIFDQLVGEVSLLCRDIQGLKSQMCNLCNEVATVNYFENRMRMSVKEIAVAEVAEVTQGASEDDQAALEEKVEPRAGLGSEQPVEEEVTDEV
jgi:hypothetical protein